MALKGPNTHSGREDGHLAVRRATHWDRRAVHVQRQFVATPRVRLDIDLREVECDGALRHEESAGDLFIAEPVDDEFGYAALARREVAQRIRRRLVETATPLLTNSSLAVERWCDASAEFPVTVSNSPSVECAHAAK